MTRSPTLRSRIKSLTPAPVSRSIAQLRYAFRKIPIDDVVLGDFVLAQDSSDRPRFNVVLPRLAAGTDFGGFQTGMDFALRMANILQAKLPLDVRLILTDVIPESDPAIFHRAAAKMGMADAIETLLVKYPGETIPVRRKDIFFTYNWWTTLNIDALVRKQAEVYRQAELPLMYIIQDYEPLFLPFSSAHMIARDAFDLPARLWGIFNSSNLFNYFGLQGHTAEKAFVFEPVISGSLRPYLEQVPTSPRGKKIVVYGRPNVDRNCFPALIRGLKRWAVDYPEFADWEIVSAGTAHKPVALGDGRSVTSVGKLSLDDYAKMMLTSSVGVSLMASPHPSYPPLEMSHMGLKTVTNGYLCKDLSSFHPNIISTPTIGERALAEAIAQACRESSAPRTAEGNSTYLRTDPYPIMDELCAAVLSELS